MRARSHEDMAAHWINHVGLAPMRKDSILTMIVWIRWRSRRSLMESKQFKKFSDDFVVSMFETTCTLTKPHLFRRQHIILEVKTHVTSPNAKEYGVIIHYVAINWIYLPTVMWIPWFHRSSCWSPLLILYYVSLFFILQLECMFLYMLSL